MPLVRPKKSVIPKQNGLKDIDYLQNDIMDGAQSTSRSENPFLIVLDPRTNDPLYGVVINLTLPPPPNPATPLVTGRADGLSLVGAAARFVDEKCEVIRGIVEAISHIAI